MVGLSKHTRKILNIILLILAIVASLGVIYAIIRVITQNV